MFAFGSPDTAFVSPRHALYPHMTIYKNIEFPLTNLKVEVPLVTFFDFGQYTYKKSIGNSEDEDELLYSVGLGLRLGYGDRFLLHLDWGVPLVKDDDKFDTSSSGRISLSASLQF